MVKSLQQVSGKIWKLYSKNLFHFNLITVCKRLSRWPLGAFGRVLCSFKMRMRFTAQKRYLISKHGSLMAIVLWIEWAGFESWLRQWVVFLGRTFFSHTASSIQVFLMPWILAKCWGYLSKCWGITCDELASHPGGVAIFLAASCYWNRILSAESCTPVGITRVYLVNCEIWLTASISSIKALDDFANTTPIWKRLLNYVPLQVLAFKELQAVV